jgi:hypothetical protein
LSEHIESSPDSKFIISVKGERHSISFFIRKAYDLSMKYDFPITIKLRKGSWEALIYQAGQSAFEGVKDVAPIIGVGTFAWKLVKYLRNKKSLQLTGISQDTARDKVIELLRTKYHLQAELTSEDSNASFFEFVFKYGHHQKTVWVWKEDGTIRVYNGTPVTTQKALPRKRLYPRRKSLPDRSIKDDHDNPSSK